MSLEFLSKKSWHTKNLGNQEKVWLAEQRALQEEGRVKELQKQIQLDREQEEMNRITGQDKKKGALDKGIDWMYSEGGGMKTSEELNEEFLMGKKFTGRDFMQQAAAVDEKAKKEGSINLILESVAENSSTLNSSTVQEPSAVPEKNDIQKVANYDDDALARNREFHLRYEDPMYLVSMRRREIEDNLKKKKDLFERVSGSKVVTISKKRDSNADIDATTEHQKISYKSNSRPKKEHRRERSRSPSREARIRGKHSREEKKHRSYYREKESVHSDSSSSTRHRYKKRRRREKKHCSYKEKETAHSESSNSDRHKSRRRRERKHSHEKHLKRHRRPRRSRSDSSQSSSGGHRFRDDREKRRREIEIIQKSAEGENTHDFSIPRGAPEEKCVEISRSNAANETDRGVEKVPGFGLQNVSLKGGLESLGPAKEVLEQKRKEKEASMVKKVPVKTSQAITAEQRAMLLAKMQSDAGTRKSVLEKALQKQDNNDQ